jgi:hypothetical protein
MIPILRLMGSPHHRAMRRVSWRSVLRGLLTRYDLLDMAGFAWPLPNLHRSQSFGWLW